MQWLSQNWLWIALGIGALIFMTRRGGIGGCGFGHSRNHGHDEVSHESTPPVAGSRPGTLIDPVSGHAFPASEAAFSTVHRGRGYYFETRENRDAFEADPEGYLTRSPSAGQAIGADEDHRERPRRRHGC
jgi:YHS domain-containing protein